MPHILLVEDDENLGYLMSDLLESEDYTITLSRDGVNGWNDFNAGQFDICLLDVMLPHQDGFTLAKQIRSVNPTVPIIFITAKNLLDDKLAGFDIGADDYITKPFDAEELLCRVKAVLKRSKLVPAQRTNLTRGHTDVHIGQYKIDSQTYTLYFNDQLQRKLTQRELDLILMLATHKNTLVKRSDILIELWGEDDYFHGRSLDVFIARLRKYFKDDSHVKLENIHSQGFILHIKDR